MTGPNKTKRKVMRGYGRPAFGTVTNIMWLIFCDDPDRSEICGMDLLNVAETKCPKGGGMEVKFFDRIRAL